MTGCKISCKRAAASLLLVALSLLTVGCTTLSAPQQSGTPDASIRGLADPARQYQQTIELGGRLSLRYEQDGLEQLLDGKFTWNQMPGFTRIVLSSPFGQTLATIEVTPTVSTLLQSGQPARSEANVDALIASALGWPLPIAGLRDWLQGFALDQRGQPHVASAGDNQAFVKTADGWLLRYPLWEEGRPRRIDLQGLTSQAGNVNLRIVLDNWQEKPAILRGPG